MVFHIVAVPTHLKSVALSTLFPSLPNKHRSFDVSQTVALLTFVNCHTFDEMWSEVLNVALPTFLNYRNSNEMWSDVLNISLPTFVSCRHSDKMWSDVLNIAHPTFLYYHSSNIFKLSQFRRLQGVSIPGGFNLKK